MWLLRRFRTFRRLICEAPAERVSIAGAEPGTDPQAISGYISVQARNGTPEPRWDRAASLIEHVARVLSLASGTYLRPYVERSLYSNTDRIRVLSHSAAAEPFLPPFHFLNLEPILRCACDSYPARSDAFRNLDSSLHWLLAPAPYDEMRLISAITALESIVALTSGPAKILGASAFKKVTTAVRAVLKQLNTPDSMRTKIAELNRPSFNERVIDILDRYQVETADLPADWLGDMISARNKIVHSGVYFDGALEQPDIWNYILISREAVIRILLSVLGFSGAYFSALHDEKQICFPSCQPLSG